jgi:hypothetical protein
VQALCARRDRVNFEVTMIFMAIVANFGLDSFNCLSGSPEKSS